MPSMHTYRQDRWGLELVGFLRPCHPNLSIPKASMKLCLKVYIHLPAAALPPSLPRALMQSGMHVRCFLQSSTSEVSSLCTFVIPEPCKTEAAKAIIPRKPNKVPQEPTFWSHPGLNASWLLYPSVPNLETSSVPPNSREFQSPSPRRPSKLPKAWNITKTFCARNGRNREMGRVEARAK